MINNEHSVFSFDLNESLFFEKGQEVNEIRSISLDPDISIQPFHDYISIRGIIELNGEYEKNSAIMDESSLESLTSEDTSQSLRYVEKVKDVEGGLSTFHHRFPVEISIPSYRVKNLEDVTVRISSFDYQLPEPSQLKLLSTIEINGIDEDVIEPQVVPDSREDEVEIVNSNDLNTAEADQDITENEVEDSFSFEMKQKPEENENREQEVAATETENSIQEEQENEEDIEEDKEEDKEASSGNKEETTNEEGRWKKTHSQTLTEFFDSKKETNEATTKDNSMEDLEFNKEVDEQESPNSNHDEVEVNQEISESNHNEAETLPLRYLSELFRDEEEQYISMRLYIVQDEDTLSSIADRYETTKMHIIKQNRLDDETVSQGQLLYVPYHSKS